MRSLFMLCYHSDLSERLLSDGFLVPALVEFHRRQTRSLLLGEQSQTLPSSWACLCIGSRCRGFPPQCDWLTCSGGPVQAVHCPLFGQRNGPIDGFPYVYRAVGHHLVSAVLLSNIATGSLQVSKGNLTNTIIPHSDRWQTFFNKVSGPLESVF